MKMHRLLGIVSFVRESGKAALVTKRELLAGVPREGTLGHGKTLYGLPCARCGAYYPADLATCPVCNSTERVFPKLDPSAWRPASVPRPKPEEVPQQQNLGLLTTINRELLANHA